MVLEPPYDHESDGLIPAIGPEDAYGHSPTSGGARPEDIQSVFIDYEETVVPQMIDAGWIEEVAKARAAPYYNDTDQTLVAHVLPGVEVLADVQKHNEDITADDFRCLVALWTIHDIHKILTPEGGEFEIDDETVQEWVDNLSLDEFAPSLTVKDFKAVAVALHNSDGANHGDQTVRFTELRPYLSLADAVMSIDDPSDFHDAARDVRTAFHTDTPFVPHSHTVDFDDAITRTLVNESVRDALVDRGLAPIDVRDNGSLYVAPVSVDIDKGVDDMLNEITDNFINNLQDSYQIFKNIAFLGSSISSPQARFQYESPRVYALTDLAKLCLSNTGLIQRIVQAAVDQQQHPWDISNESRQQISAVENATGKSLQRSQRLEGFAALVHTVYREVLPEIVTGSNSDPAYERTRLSALMHVFGISHETQKEVSEVLESGDLDASPVNWPYKYIIAQDLLERYQGLPRKEKQEKLTNLVLSRLQDFELWDEFGMNQESDIHEEIRVRLAGRIDIDGEGLNVFGDASDANDIIMDRAMCDTEKCALCNEPTVEPGIGPNLISHRDYDILETEFITEEDGELNTVTPDSRMPQKPICVVCQLSLTIRAQQFDGFFEDESESSLHITVHPVTSFSSASLVRFQKIVNKLKDDVFSGEHTGLELDSLGEWYADEIASELKREAGVEALTDRDRAADIGARFDASASRLALPADNKESIAQGALIATAAGLLSGVRVVLTKSPQLYMDNTEQKELVTYGPELDILSTLFEGETGVMKMPTRLRLIDSLVSLGSVTDQPLNVVDQYNQLDDPHVLAGSRLFRRMNQWIDSNEEMTEAAEHAEEIDKILSKGDTFANSIMTATDALGYQLGVILPRADPNLANAVLKSLLDVLETNESVNDMHQLRTLVLERLATLKALNIDPVELLEGGNAHKLATNIISMYQNTANGKPDQLNAIRRPIEDGTTLRAMKHAMENKGDS